MLYTARIQNSLGDEITLNDKENKWVVTDISGLNPAPGTINLTECAGINGAIFNSARIGYKNIVVTLELTGNVEKNRHELYRYFRVAEPCRFFYKNEGRDVFIDGVIENAECGPFTQKEMLQASIICPIPFFSGVELKTATLKREYVREEIMTEEWIVITTEAGTDLITEDKERNIDAKVAFPFSVEIGEPVEYSVLKSSISGYLTNAGDTDTGIVITIEVKETCEDIRITNETTGKSIELTLHRFLAGDVITIDTRPTKKKIVLLRSGEEQLIFGSLTNDSELFQLQPGENGLSYTVDAESNSHKCLITVEYRDQFKGV